METILPIKKSHHISKDPNKNNNWDYSPLTFVVIDFHFIAYC